MALTGAEKQARYRAKQKAKGQGLQGGYLPGKRPSRSKPWCFIDTEGADDMAGEFYGDPGHQYTMMITAADGDGFEKHLCTGRPLSTTEMLQFIVSLPNNYKYGGYFFGYDTDQILWNLPAYALGLIYGGPRTPGVIMPYQDYAIEKFNTRLTLYVPPYHMDGPIPVEDLKGAFRRPIWDVGRFYAMGFANAVEAWGIEDPTADLEFLERMKADRADFDLAYFRENKDDMIRYSLLENRLAARLQTKFDMEARNLGYPLTQWYGAGSMAKAMMIQEGVKKHLDARLPYRAYKNPKHRMETVLPYAFFGGRFELQAPGRVHGDVYEYDINSAYPASYRNLPCLIHGDWIRRSGRRWQHSDGPASPHDLHHVKWDMDKGSVGADMWGPFPQRDAHQNVAYPLIGEGYVWGEELAAAWPMYWDVVDVREIWQYQKRCDCHPFEWIDAVYARRKALPKVQGIPLKLGMNAAYGSLASTLGAVFDHVTRLHESGWFEPRWASLITAWCRARLLEALQLAGGRTSDTVVMFATDALYTTEPLPIPDSDRLGGWEAEHFNRGGLLIQPGLYDLEGVKSKLKVRGISEADVREHLGEFYAAWDADGWDAAVTFQMRPRYQTARLTMARGTYPHKAHRWDRNLERTVTFHPHHKRTMSGAFERGVPPTTMFSPHCPSAGFDLVLNQQPIPDIVQEMDDQKHAAALVDFDQPRGLYAR